MFLLYASPPARVRALGQASAATLAYIAAVEAADGAELEGSVLEAIVPFANWRIPLGGACCILAGARTLAGALVPLVGTAPTGVNLVAGDYNRSRIALNGSTKYINTNVNNNTLSQNDCSLAVLLSSPYAIAAGFPSIIGGVANQAGQGTSIAFCSGSNFFARLQSENTTQYSVNVSGVVAAALVGISRSSSGSFSVRRAGTTFTATSTSLPPFSHGIAIGANGDGSNLAAISPSAYSIGPAIDLAELDARMSAATSAIAAALA